MKQKNIVLIECNSTSISFLNDIKRRNCQPIVIQTKLGPEMEKLRDASTSRYPKGVIIVKAPNSYKKLLELVRSYNPIVVLPGTEATVALTCHIQEDLGLPGNQSKNINLYIHKDAMHEALKKAGIRYIRGENVKNATEAVKAYRKFNGAEVVLKPPHGAGAQCVYFCKSEEEVKRRANEFFNTSNVFGEENKELLVQERIIGEEYVVNCMSRNGAHRVLSVWKYQLIQTPDGRYIFGNIESVNELEIGATDIINYTYKMLDALKYYNGPSHNEFLIDEKGPVLLELNARVMGGPLYDYFVTPIFAHHDTDQILEDLLFPDNFDNKALKPYTTKKKGYIKYIVVPRDLDVKSLPIINIAKRLRSFLEISYNADDRPSLTKTVDFETTGGAIYLLHEDYNIAKEDNDFLHMVETLYFDVLFEDKKESAIKKYKSNNVDVQNIVNYCQKRATTLVLNDDDKIKADFVVVTSLDNVEKQVDMFECGIINLTKEHKNIRRDVLIEKLLVFMEKIRTGGTVYISEATFNIFPYGSKGLELLLKVAGYQLDIAPMYFHFMIANKK